MARIGSCFRETISMNAIHYHIEIKEPHKHCIKTTAIFGVDDNEYLDVSIPAWIPGAYLIEDFCRNIINQKARDEKGKLLPCDQVEKGTWRIMTGNRKQVKVTYNLYANELHDHSCHVDESHAYITCDLAFDGYRSVFHAL